MDGEYDARGGVERRTVLQLLAAGSVTGGTLPLAADRAAGESGRSEATADTAGAASAQSDEDTTYLVEQGEGTSFEVTPLRHDATVEDFYNFGFPVSNTPTGIERSDVSELLLYEPSDREGEVSLVLIHDVKGDGTGGEAPLDFEGLPIDEGEWVVTDDPPSRGGDFDSRTDTSVEWGWSGEFNDGGAFRGGVGDALASGGITVVPPSSGEWGRRDGGEIEAWRALTASEGFATDFDFGSNEFEANGWTPTVGSFSTDDSDLVSDGGGGNSFHLAHEQPAPAGTFEMRGVRNDARFFGLRSVFISETDLQTDTRGYMIRWEQTRHSEIVLVRLDDDGGDELVTLTDDHRGQRTDVRIERDPEDWRFDCYLNGEHVGHVYDDKYKESNFWVQRHDAGGGRQRVGGVAAEPASEAYHNAAGTLNLGKPVTIRRSGTRANCSEKTPVVDPTEQVTLENERVSLKVGARGSRSWEIDGTEALFEEFFALEDADGNHLRSTEMTVEDGFDAVGGDAGGETAPGVEYSATLSGTLGGNEVSVERFVHLDACAPHWRIDHEVTLESPGTTVDNLRLYQYTDYDVDGCEADRGAFRGDDGVALVEPVDGSPVAGFRAVSVEAEDGGELPDAHHVGEAPARDAVASGSLNGADSFPADDGGDPAVVEAWDLGPLSTATRVPRSFSDSAFVGLRFAAAGSVLDLTASLTEASVRTLAEATEVVDVDVPPTAVETDERVGYAATLDTCVDPALFGGAVRADVSWRSDSLGSTEAGVSVEVTEDDLVEVSGSLNPATAFREPPYGVGYASAFEVTAGPTNQTVVEVPGLGSDRPETYAFEEVDAVGLVAALPSGGSPTSTNADLHEEVRTKAEFLNEHYASGLGSMGAKGFDVRNLNARFPDATNGDGWLELDEPRSAFGGTRAVGFVQGSLEAAEDEFGVAFADEFDTAFVVSDELVGGRPFYNGRVIPRDIETLTIIIGALELRISGALLADALPDALHVSPYQLDSGETDGVYAPLHTDPNDGGAWRHEFGHGAASGTRVGLPDLYFLETPVPLTLGTIQGWGLMGDGDTMSAFCRVLGGDIWDPTEGWLAANPTLHALTDATVEPRPLTGKELGDNVQFVVSAFAEFDVEVGFGGIDITPVDFKIVPYVVEARRGGASNIADEFTAGDLQLSPAGADQSGVALYRFGLLEVGGQDRFEDVLSGRSPFQINDPEVVDIDYLTRDGEVGREEFPDLPTLSRQRNANPTFHDPVTATRFEMTDGFDTPEVTLKRDVVDLVIPDVPFVTTVVAAVVDFFSDIVDDFRGLTHEDESLPPLDVVAEMPDGRRVGTDPETGEVVNEIDGARVIGTGDARGIVVPGNVEFDVTVSDSRLAAALEDRGFTPPDSFEYDQTVIVDDDTTIEDRDGVPYLAGRTTQRVRTDTADAGPAVTVVNAAVEPGRLNARSNGEFVTASLGVPEGADAADLVLESVVVAGVQAVTDDTYGFVRNVPTSNRGGTEHVLVKFPREELVAALGAGDHEVAISAVFGRTSVRGTADLTIVEAGDGSRGSGS